MIKHLLRVSFLLAVFEPSYQASSINSKSYIGAVVEYHPVTNGANGQTVAEENAKYYRTIIETASAYNVDIIVFPEFGLTGMPKDGTREKDFTPTEYRAFYRDVASHVPSPDESIIPCDVDGKYKKSISCAARDHKMYVVVNHQERADCPQPNCAPDDFLLYNTNVAFDRGGKVVARYRKFHLADEAGTNVTAEPEYSTFATDFGVTFGQFICFDILQEKPASYFVRQPNVTDVVFSTHWFDELPFNVAVQQQAAGAHGADVNLLASAYSDAQTTSGGSGIYAGKFGPIRVYSPHRTSNALIIAEIPKFNKGRHVLDLKVSDPVVVEIKNATVSGKPILGKDYPALFRDDLRPYTTKLLDPRTQSYTTSLCHNGLCCDFEVKMSYDKDVVAGIPGAKQYSYRMVAFNGVGNVANVMKAGLEVCAVVACAGPRLEDCGASYLSNAKVVRATTFDSLLIARRANTRERVFYEPSTLTVKRSLPFEDKDFRYLVSEQRNSSLLLTYLLRPQSDLMTFGIYGRRFDRHG